LEKIFSAPIQEFLTKRRLRKRRTRKVLVLWLSIGEEKCSTKPHFDHTKKAENDQFSLHLVEKFKSVVWVQKLILWTCFGCFWKIIVLDGILDLKNIFGT
jgi:hypothetical protein